MFPGYNRPLRKGGDGPPVANSDGGEANPDVGFYIRATQAPLDTSNALTLSGAFQDIPLAAAAPLVLSFANPQPNLRYYGEIAVPIENGGAAVYTSQFSCQFRRTDSNGVVGAWSDQDPDQRYDYDQSQATVVTNQVVYRTRPVLGSAILVDPVQAGDQLLEIKFVALGTNNPVILSGYANRWAWFFETL